MSDWASGLGLRVPVVCAPMGGVAGGRLAAAVTAAGALGMIGMGSAGSAAALRREIDALHANGVTCEPWGIGMVDWGITRHPDMFEVALEARPAVVSVSFGEWGAGAAPQWIAAAQNVGALAVTQVSTAEEAKRAADAGLDAVIARGEEAGGHGDHQRPGRLLLQEVLGAVDIPVLAAGAIHTADDLVRVLSEGAAAAWVGTAFSACTEALTSDAARKVLFAAKGENTVVSRVLDVALERPWPERFPERLLRTEFVDRWHGREAELAGDAETRAGFRAAVEADDYSVVPLDAGLAVTALTQELSAAEVVSRFMV